MMKSLPAVQETQARSLGWEDALEKGMATHSSILTQRIPWTEEPGGTAHGVTKRGLRTEHIDSRSGTVVGLFGRCIQGSSGLL